MGESPEVPGPASVATEIEPQTPNTAPQVETTPKKPLLAKLLGLFKRGGAGIANDIASGNAQEALNPFKTRPPQSPPQSPTSEPGNP